jgi:2-hydroxy-3-keto-5-methylthiopentenyl-1-phosphate phosphatase
MPKRPEVEVEEELKENEEFISRDDIDIEVMSSSEEPEVYVKFSGFDDIEDAEEYAEFLAETLPLLLFESTRLQ